MECREVIEKKKLGNLCEGEEGVITAIRGPGTLHRFLLQIGIIAGITVIREACGPHDPDSSVPFKIGRKVVYLPENTISHIKVAASRAGATL